MTPDAMSDRPEEAGNTTFSSEPITLTGEQRQQLAADYAQMMALTSRLRRVSSDLNVLQDHTAELDRIIRAGPPASDGPVVVDAADVVIARAACRVAKAVIEAFAAGGASQP